MKLYFLNWQVIEAVRNSIKKPRSGDPMENIYRYVLWFSLKLRHFIHMFYVTVFKLLSSLFCEMNDFSTRLFASWRRLFSGHIFQPSLQKILSRQCRILAVPISMRAYLLMHVKRLIWGLGVPLRVFKRGIFRLSLYNIMFNHFSFLFSLSFNSCVL